MTDHFLDQNYFGNILLDYLITIGLIVFGILLIRFFRKIILAWLKAKAKKTDTSFDDIVISVVEEYMLPFFNIAVVYFSIEYLTLSIRIEKILNYSMAVVVTYFVIRLVTKTLQLTLHSFALTQEKGEKKIKQLGGITIVINVIVWSLGIVFLFNNLGYDVTAIVTGLGIGGVAIALAAQNILGDLFNYFVIFFDQPFEIGDFIVIGDKVGVVEYIGIKTTRLKSLSGEQIIFSNSDLTGSRVHNFKRMQRRRVLFSLGIQYDTPAEKIKEIPDLVKEIISSKPNAQFDRAHFFKYGSFSLDFEIVYYVEGSDYNVYMDIQQSVNLDILEAFQKREIAFAFPTQTILLPNNG